jgi:hypothetical protein
MTSHFMGIGYKPNLSFENSFIRKTFMVECLAIKSFNG